MNIVEVICGMAGCGYSPFPMEKSYYERVRRTGETWYCPGGHARCYNDGKTADEVEIDRLNARIREMYERFGEQLQAAWDRSHQCPWPGCRDYVYASRDSMYGHMRRAHGMPVAALVLEEAS
ncbi:MAG: hypothetical protein ABIJ75_03525 [Actinomycetota bacterium]